MKAVHLTIRLLLLLLTCLPFAYAQAPIVGPSSLSLDEISQRAGLIFVGTVISIESRKSAALVEVTFAVDDGIRSARSGDQVSIHEWAGLWSGPPRYRVGERMLLFLHGTQVDGLTSPVGGTAGIFRFTKGDGIKLTDAQRLAVTGSDRMRAALAQSETDLKKSFPAKDLLRALRLVTDSQ
jgi:hypothetical protein